MKHHLLIIVILSLAVPVQAQDSDFGDKLAQHARTHTVPEGTDCFAAVYQWVQATRTDANLQKLPPVSGPGADASFRMIWNTNFDFEGWKQLKSPYRDYRACGPAGGIVALGLADLVPHQEIWKGNLKPGALVQVWSLKSDMGDYTKANNEVFKKLFQGDPSMKCADPDQCHYMGHAFIFLNYTEDGEGMYIRDQGWLNDQVVSKSRFGLWIGANWK